jgi:thiosulfate/3-mercaptopyruvate sulfurtransferase
MKTLIITLSAILSFSQSFAQQDPWKKEQVMPTATLASKIQSKSKDLPFIINVGPMGNIKTAISIGSANTEAGIGKLKLTAASLDKNKTVVLYCGCCTYSNCPNIRPAFKELESLGFKNVKVLNIPEGLTPDWIGKGYPME